MKKLVFGMSALALALTAGEWKGTISDSKCGAAHADASEKSVACVQACVKSGKATPVLVSDGKIYKFADNDKAKAHLGHKVVVNGELTGDTIAASSIEMQGQ